MATLMLINPKGRTKMAKTRKHRSPAQKAATRKMLAANRARRGGRASPARKTRRRKTYAANPVASVRRKRRSHVAHAVRHSRRRRSNPISLREPMQLLMPALKGAIGALTVNAVFNYTPLPLFLRNGKMAYLSKGLIAIAFGVFGKKFLGNTAVQMAEGALTVIATNAAQDLLANTSLRLGDADGIAYYSPADIAPGSLLSNPEQNLGAYVDGGGMSAYQRELSMGMYQAQ